MAPNANAGRGPGVAVISSWEKQTIAAEDSPHRAALQDPPPREHHHPLPDDKLVLFELPAVWRLVGVWQGPGTIAQLRRP
jgi:hypothetical protein